LALSIVIVAGENALGKQDDSVRFDWIKLDRIKLDWIGLDWICFVSFRFLSFCRLLLVLNAVPVHQKEIDACVASVKCRMDRTRNDSCSLDLGFRNSCCNSVRCWLSSLELLYFHYKQVRTSQGESVSLFVGYTAIVLVINLNQSIK